LLDKFSTGLRQVHIHFHPYSEKHSKSDLEPDSKTNIGVSL